MHAFYQLAICNAKVPLETPVLIQLGKTRYSLKNYLPVFSQTYQLISQDTLLPMKLILVVRALQAARPSLHQGRNWYETHIALVPVAVQLQNSFYKAPLLVYAQKGVQKRVKKKMSGGLGASYQPCC